MIAALLKGVRQRVEDVSGLPTAVVGIRPGANGRPFAAYKGGGYYAGVYFAGLVNTGTGLEDFDVTVRVGVDVTAVLGDIPTAVMGDWLIGDAGIYPIADKVIEGMLRGDSVVANLCNGQLGGDETRGKFYEDFVTVSASPARTESAEWVAARQGKSMDPTIQVVSAVFGGMKYHKILTEIPR